MIVHSALPANNSVGHCTRNNTQNKQVHIIAYGTAA